MAPRWWTVKECCKRLRLIRLNRRRFSALCANLSTRIMSPGKCFCRASGGADRRCKVLHTRCVRQPRQAERRYHVHRACDKRRRSRITNMQIILCLAAAMICGLLLTRVVKPVHLPNVTGYLIAGLIIGPYCLGIFKRATRLSPMCLRT